MKCSNSKISTNRSLGIYVSLTPKSSKRQIRTLERLLAFSSNDRRFVGLQSDCRLIGEFNYTIVNECPAVFKKLLVIDWELFSRPLIGNYFLVLSSQLFSESGSFGNTNQIQPIYFMYLQRITSKTSILASHPK